MTDTPPGLLHVAALVDKRLATLFEFERAHWADVDERLTEAIDELSRITMGGKRLRAGFCYWAWLGAIGAEDESNLPELAEATDDQAPHRRIIDAAAAFELLQAFALIHDDIMDDADTRRNERTIHVAQATKLTDMGWRGEPRRYGDGVALLVGDLSHVYADQLIGSASDQTRHLWDRLRIELNLGQYLDMRSAAAGDLDRETAQRVATFKSALYTIVRPLQLGASIAGNVSDELLDQLDRYGRPAGQAFQLRDDLLDVVGDADRVGKPVGNDLREGKPTELVAVAYERASKQQLDTLAMIGIPDLTSEQAATITDVLVDTGAVAEIEERIEALVERATTVAGDLPFSSSIKQTLIAFANYVAARQV